MKQELKKHIAAIRVSNSVGLLARKSWNVLLLNAYDELLTKDEHEIELSVLFDVIGYNSRNFKSFDIALEKLENTSVLWDLGGGAEVKGVWVKNFGRAKLVSGIRVEDGILTYEFSSMLKKLLYNPKIYKVINLAQQKNFKTSYGLALWENCLRFANVNSTGFASVEEWREVLGANAKSYNEFKRFKAIVLSKAINEVNTVSDIEVSLKTRRKGRRITEISFDIKEKPSKDQLSPAIINKIKESKQYKTLIDYGIHKVKGLNFIEEYGKDYIQDKIDYTQAQQKLGKIKSNPSGFLIKAIQEDYKDSVKIEADKQAAEQSEKENQAKEERRKAKIKDLEQKFAKEFGLMARENFLLSRSEEEKQTLMNEIIKRCKYDDNTMASGALRKGKWDSPFIAHYINLSIPNFEEDKALYIQEKLKEAGLIK